tara:strand:- start:255 stop:977 length:723 start_codon:yes stop_codon:yes gene_type:complete
VKYPPLILKTKTITMKQERDFKGVWIPKEIWMNKDLTIMQKLFLVEINSLDNDSGCFAGNAHFVDMFELSKQRCSQIINSLAEKEYINIKLIYNGKQIQKRIIRVSSKFDRVSSTLEGVSSFQGEGVKKMRGGCQEKLIVNNTISNTVNNTVNKKKKSVSFKKPTIIEIKEYCTERKNNVDSETFYHFYESKDWQIGKEKMKNWKSCVITWEKSNRNNNTNDRTTSDIHRNGGDYGDGSF